MSRDVPADAGYCVKKFLLRNTIKGPHVLSRNGNIGAKNTERSKVYAWV